MEVSLFCELDRNGRWWWDMTAGRQPRDWAGSSGLLRQGKLHSRDTSASPRGCRIAFCAFIDGDPSLPTQPHHGTNKRPAIDPPFASAVDKAGSPSSLCSHATM